MKKAVLVALLVAGAIAFFAFDLDRFLTLEALKAQQARTAAFYAVNPGRALVLFFLFYVAVTTLSLPGGALLTLVAGAIFGLGAGTLLVSFASSLGALLAFLVARSLLRDIVQRRFAPTVRVVDAGVARDGPFYLFAMRLVPAIPFFVVNAVMGLTGMRPWTYYWVSQLGMLPGTAVYVNAGTQLAQLESLSGIFSPQLLGSFLLLAAFPLAARKALEVWRKRR